MKKYILIIGLSVVLSILSKSVYAQTASIVGYGSDSSQRIHLIDLETATIISSFDVGVELQGLAIDPSGETLYGSDQNGLLYKVDIATETITTIGSTGIESIEAMDFNFNGEELWVTDHYSSPPTIYSINTSDASSTLVRTLDPAIGGDVKAMTADTTKDVWIANDSFPMMEFQSVDTEASVSNVTFIGGLDDDTTPFPVPNVNPAIRGMDRAINGVLYGLSNQGGLYIINQETIDETTTPRLSPVDPANPGNIIIVDGTGAAISWLALAISTADSQEPGNESQNAVGEITVGRENNCQNNDTGQRVAKSMHIETYNSDPELLNLWNTLFGVDPDDPVASPDGLITLQGPNRTITWEEGRLEMNGTMGLKVKSDCRNPDLKIVTIEKAGRCQQGTTGFVSGTGGLNPHLADGGWHEVVIKKLDNVTVSFGNYTITGFLQLLKIKLDEDGTTAVKQFKLKIRGTTDSPNVCRGTVSSVIVDAPQTVVTALAGTEYDEKMKDNPEILSGHIEAEFEREPGAGIEGIDISSLLDGNNDKLKVRKGPCVIDDAVSEN